jgi:hypothetical protein
MSYRARVALALVFFAPLAGASLAEGGIFVATACTVIGFLLAVPRPGE